MLAFFFRVRWSHPEGMLRAASFRAWIDGALDSTFLALLEERNDILGIQFSYLKENKVKVTLEFSPCR